MSDLDEIDQMLFDAGCMALSATTPNDRADVDRKITDARVKLQQLRDRVSSSCGCTLRARFT